MDNLIEWDALSGNAKTAPKKLVTAFKKAGAEIAASWVGEKEKRESGVTFKEVGFTMADSQAVTLRVKRTGDIYQVRLNNKVLAIKEQDDFKAALVEVVKAVDANADKFQRALARKKVTEPKGMTNTRLSREKKQEQEEQELDLLIADAKKTLESLSVSDKN